jgi:hypothetical protein
MMIPLTLFLYLAVDAPAQTLMRALFKKRKSATKKAIPESNNHFLFYNI